MKKLLIATLKLTILTIVVCGVHAAEAATLGLSPATGVYTAGATFSVSVLVNTAGQSVNAADGTLSFNPQELSVVAVSRGSSIFNLWTTEPTFSNAVGTVSFSGGSPTGFSGAVGTVMTVTFRTVAAGSPRVTFSSGSVLAADGKGTNVLTTMGSGSYTVSAQSSAPQAESIVEYVPPANTPAQPKITSTTHPDQNGWSNETTAILNWTLPGDITSVRTLLDENKTAIPNKVYDTPIKTITLKDLAQGESYFHIQFKNKDVWGKVTHYRLGVDSEAPQGVALQLSDTPNLANPDQVIHVATKDTAGAPLKTFKVQVDGGEVMEFANVDGKNEFTLKGLQPGSHTIVATIYDEAGNSAVANTQLTIEAFSAPTFTDIPSVVTPDVIPVLTGATRPHAKVEVTLAAAGFNPQILTVQADDKGNFRVIPDGKLVQGVYTITATAADEFGARSEVSTSYKMLVQPSGLMRVGTLLVSVLSVVVPLIALTILSLVSVWYLVYKMRTFRRRVHVEAEEVVEKLKEQFAHIYEVLDVEEEQLLSARKTKKLTQAETDLINKVREALGEAERRVEKEADDVAVLTD